ncbi:LysR family transcriptional regulator [Psychromonas sp. Urea-02u-13]|uniref:LysR family transcriptional regulator n=1 Tax=Psychromonas sp. Urea-02u-13 TaxID=2058326 RepID=UPI000C3400DA|nr:LysR family transcriptional regulator [Psychromonas sp. Urea-02u-13]PKG38289.1 LysR family transcriptional regulator [Psychromonas sp. Urea-02u-13]
MEFYHLRSFVAVAQTGNLTQAAKRLYTTPPAISAHIKMLEEELSTLLFIRSSKGMSLTDKGQLLLKKAQVTLDSAVDLVNLAADKQHEIMGTFHLGINLTAKQARLPALAKNIQHNCPGINLDIHSQSTGKTITDIRNKQLCGGYIFGDVPDDFLGFAVMQQLITTVAPTTFDCSKILTKTDLCSHQWIMMGDYCPFDCFLKKKLGNDIPSVMKTSDDGTRLALVKSGLGLSLLEKEEALEAEKNATVQILPELDFTTTLYFVIAKNRANEPVIKALMQEIRVLWGIAL